MITFKDIEQNQEIKTYIKQADKSLIRLGYTEHSFAHVTKCAMVAGQILTDLGYNAHTIELAKIAAYMHDIGNVINRTDHAQSGAVMAFSLLNKINIPSEDIALIISAIVNHDESTAFPVNELAAALILADKTDVRRSRVRNKETATFDIHDRVNYAAEKSDVTLDVTNKTVTLYITLDNTICKMSEYFEIFLNRMLLCRRAAEFFNLDFKLNINGNEVM